MFYKKRSIEKYLDNKQAESELTIFDFVLCDYLSKKLKSNLKKIGLYNIEIHIDWFNDYKCVGIQACFNHKVMVNIQIYEEEFDLGYSYDESDCDENYSYPKETSEDASFIYNIVKKQLNTFIDNKKYK